VGDDSVLRLVTNLDRSDSYNYEVAVRSGDMLVNAVLNVRQPNRALLDDLIQRAWRRATEAKVVN
jgi:hypothetical protein